MDSNDPASITSNLLWDIFTGADFPVVNKSFCIPLRHQNCLGTCVSEIKGYSAEMSLILFSQEQIPSEMGAEVLNPVGCFSPMLSAAGQCPSLLGAGWEPP